MLNLQTVKKVATIKAQLVPIHQELANRIQRAASSAKDRAVASFEEYFSNSGFVVSGDARRSIAKYADIQFVLETDDAAVIGSFCTFTVTPPAGFGTSKLTLRMVRADNRNLVTIIQANPDPVREAERELEEAEKMLVASAPEFSFIAMDQQAAGRLSHQPNRANSLQVFSSMSAVLTKYFPQ